jgi:hypothetical protein
MNPNRPRFSLRLLTTALSCAVGVTLPGAAFALGLGAAHGQQQIGRPLYAEVQLQSAEEIDAACFSVVPVPGDEAFFVRDISVTLEGQPLARRLSLRSVGAIREPMVSFRLQASCEGIMSRDYTLIANPPRNSGVERPVAAPRVTAPVAVAAAAVPARRNAVPPAPTLGIADSGANETRLTRATTLNAMARALFPDDRASRDRYRAAIAAANPDLFSGVEHVGAVSLPAGTRLVMPADLPGAPPAPPRAKPRAPGAAVPDKLTVGVNQAPFKRLTDAIERLEQMQSERQQREGELVNALANAVSGIVDLGERIKTQDARINALAEQQRNAEIEARREREAAPALGALLALIAAAGAVGAALMGLHHRLAMRRVAPAFAGEFERPVSDAGVAGAKIDAELATVYREAPAETPTASPQGVRRMPPATASLAAAPAAAAASKDEGHELGLDSLMDSFHRNASEVVSAIDHIRLSDSRDPADWLTLMRSARSAGLLNDQSVAQMSTRFREMFNISLDGPPGAGLESFPHLLPPICIDWGRSACLGRLADLIYDDREGLRRGFPEAAADDLICLRDVLLKRIAMFGEEQGPPPDPESIVVSQPIADAGEDAAGDGPRRAEKRAAEREFSIEFTRDDL